MENRNGAPDLRQGGGPEATLAGHHVLTSPGRRDQTPTSGHSTCPV